MAGVIQACDGMCFGGATLRRDRHNGSLNVNGFFFTYVQVSVCRPEKRDLFVPHRIKKLLVSVFKLDSIYARSNSGPHMSSISICRNCETFTTMDCDRFHKLSFSVALGGGRVGSTHHLLIVTVPNTFISSWLSAVTNSPLTELVYAKI